MGIEHFVLVTCERCGKKEQHHPSGDHRAAAWEANFATVWQPSATPLYARPTGEGPSELVCLDCLTDAERELYDNAKHHDDVPF
jgi:hypothetical protein